MKILNAFSINMVPGGGHLAVREVSVERVIERCTNTTPVESCVGHAETAAVFSAALGISIPYRRVGVVLEDGETAFVGQYAGPRLPEGATSVAPGGVIRWYRVTFVSVPSAIWVMRHAVDGLLSYREAERFVPGAMPG